MQIWIDGDACPKAVKEILYRAAKRTQTPLVIVANHFVQTPPSPLIQCLVVDKGFDIADQHIIDQVQPHDLVITADIPLADAIISKQAHALNPRGKLYTPQNIKHLLMSRNINETLRENGMISGGGIGKLNNKDIQQFSNHLDRILAKQ